MVDLIRAEVAQVVEQQTEGPLPRQALVGVAQSAILCNQVTKQANVAQPAQYRQMCGYYLLMPQSLFNMIIKTRLFGS